MDFTFLEQLHDMPHTKYMYLLCQHSYVQLFGSCVKVRIIICTHVQLPYLLGSLLPEEFSVNSSLLGHFSPSMTFVLDGCKTSCD